MLPTEDRNPPSILLTYKNENILIDCGEGTQRQLRKAKISPTKITKLLITHFHGDHILGIPGLLQTLGASNYENTLEIYGLEGTKKYLKNLLSGFIFKENISLDIKEISSGILIKNKDFSISASNLEHSSPVLGFSFQEADKRKINLSYTKKFGLTKHPLLGQLQRGRDIVYKGSKITVDNSTILVKGKKITFISDTSYCNNAIKLAKDSDLLISEATFASDLKEKAHNYKHLTAEDAALIAKNSNSKSLILTHLSQRYKDPNLLLQEAKKIFKNTKIAEDFLEIKL